MEAFRFPKPLQRAAAKTINFKPGIKNISLKKGLLLRQTFEKVPRVTKWGGVKIPKEPFSGNFFRQLYSKYERYEQNKKLGLHWPADFRKVVVARKKGGE